MKGNTESVQMERDLQKAMHETTMAELKLELAESCHAKLLAFEAQKFTDTKALFERFIELVNGSRMRESALLEEHKNSRGHVWQSRQKYAKSTNDITRQ